MKKLLSAALVSASVLGATVPGFAGEGEGVVAAIEPATGTIMLEDGTAWTVGADVDVTALAVGDSIKVTYEDGTTVLTSVEKM